MRITVIIPTYNEAENLPTLVSALFDLPLDISLLVVDDDSPDGCGQVADQLSKEYPGRMNVLHRPGKQGLRSAYLNGFRAVLESGAEAIAQMDADLSHDPAVLPVMVEILKTCDVVLGSRYIPGGSVDKNWPIWRKLLSSWANFYVRTILGLPLGDITTGYRLWRATTLQAMPLDRIRANGYIFLVEMVYLAWCLDFHLEEIPIYFAERCTGKSKMSLGIQLEAAVRVWQVLLNYRQLRQLGRAGRLTNK